MLRVTDIEILEALPGICYVIARPAYLFYALRKAFADGKGADAALAYLLGLARIMAPIIRAWPPAPELEAAGFEPVTIGTPPRN